MSLRDFVARLLGTNLKPSDALLRHIAGTGSGYELDDLAHGSHSDEVEREAVEPLLEINRQFSTQEYPLGISNPAAAEAIRKLADSLRARGL